MPRNTRSDAIAADPPSGTAELDASIIRLIRLAAVGLFAMLPWLGAMVAIPVGKYGVPITLQTLAVVLAALCIGPRLGAASMAGYLVLGLVGFPVFADGAYGPAAFYGQTGGYLLGFLLCQPVIAGIIRRRDGSIRGWGAMILAVLAGHLVIFSLGVPWLWFTRRFVLDDPAISWWQAFYNGCVIFLPGMVLKTGIAVWLGRLAAPWASRRIW